MSEKPKLEVVPEEVLDEDEAEFRQLRRDIPGVKGASAIGIVAVPPKWTFTGYFSAPPPSRTRRVTFGHLPEKVK